MQSFLLLLLLASSSVAFREPHSRSETEEAFYKEPFSISTHLDELLRNYDARVHPHFNEKHPTLIECSAYIDSIDSINEQTMDYSVNFYLRQRWEDPRLRHPNIDRELTIADLPGIHRFWIPDTFIPNEKSRSGQSERMLRVNPDGRVIYSIKFTAKLTCPMKLHNFPFDTQECGLRIESFGHGSNDVIFAWRHAKSEVRISDKIHLPQFRMEHVSTPDCSGSYSIGNFSCLGITLRLRRMYCSYFTHVYLPSILIVIVSWTAFWMDARFAFGRAAFGLLTAMSMSMLTSNSAVSLIHVSYTKAIDVWVGTCFFIIFAVPIQYLILRCLSHRRRHAHSQSHDTEHKTELLGHASTDNLHSNCTHLEQTNVRLVRCGDRLSRILFPVFFGVFNIVYWSFYLTRQQ